MKHGIDLGPPQPRWLPLVPWLVAGALAGTAVHWWYYASERTRLEAERAVVGAIERDAEASSEADWSRTSSATLSALHALRDSGVLDAITPTAVFRLLETTLPPGVAVVSVSLRTSPPDPHLLVDAVAENESQITQWQSQVDAEALVSGTRLLEERLGPDGMRSVRLQVRLRAAGRP